MAETITQVAPLPSGRPETGPMQFGDDWPGVFIRGDNALFDARAIDAALMFVPKERWDIASMLRGLRDTLQSCSVGDTGWPPRIPQDTTGPENNNG
jgi:hypothetical protein